MSQRVTILGSTGSIGESTLSVVDRHRDRFTIDTLTADKSVDVMRAQIERFSPRRVVMADPSAADKLASTLPSDCGTQVEGGKSALIDAGGAPESDIVMAAIVGGAGLEATLAAARAGKRVLLANKESLVMSGGLFMDTVRTHGATLLPIDSEHNAIFQSLGGDAVHAGGVTRIILTASGGPLLRRPLDSLADVTPDEACAHPNWDMGRKISVDSATMMNKGLELIEACWLFDVPPTQVEIVIHPQSIVHSLVAYEDGSVISQMGNPDMRTPIAYGLSWPERIDAGVEALDLVNMGALEFEPAPPGRFPCLDLARQVAGQPQGLSIALNAANEVAVSAFLNELIRFTEIPLVIERVLEHAPACEAPTIEAVLEADARARHAAARQIEKLNG